MDIGKKLNETRTVQGISIYKLSKVADVSENYLRSIEKGKSQPSIHILEKILENLGTTLPEFFNEHPEAIYPSPFEIQLIRNVRLLTSEKAQMVLDITKMFSK